MKSFGKTILKTFLSTSSFWNLPKFFPVRNYSNDCCSTDEIGYCTCSCGCESCLCGPPKAIVGKAAPSFTKEALMVDGQFGEISLNDYAGKWLCLFFYPLDFTFVCPTEILAFSDRVKEFQEAKCEVLGVSVDSKFSHYAWTKNDRKEGGLGDIDIPLVSDMTHTMSRDYGVLTDFGFATRGLFLIDPEGNLRQTIINDVPIGRNVDEVLRLLDALQFFEENGEVCPIGWEKGDDTIKPTMEGVQEYFTENFPKNLI